MGFAIPARLKGEGQEAFLSRMGQLHEEYDAKQAKLTVEGLRDLRRKCDHVWVNKSYYDECVKCGDARA